jgi:multiple sugar transport system substrate-binding protein
MSRSTRTSALVGGLAVVALGLSACGGGDAGGSEAEGATESAGPIAMWARATTAPQSQALVDAWNASHDQQVELTVVPTDNYLQKVGVAAGSDELPCLMASDVVYMPNFLQQNLYQDITDRVEGLDFADALAPGHMNLATEDGAIYGVPHNVSVSVISQNDVLLEQAGIDPAKQLESLEELAANAEKVAALGGDTIGLYYTGNNAGSISFTHFPAIWASGGEAISEDGTESLLDSPEAVEVFSIFNEMDKSGASSPGVRDESGATRNDVFAKGNVGYMMGSSVIGAVPESETLTIGVQGIPGVDGGRSAFVGGDAIGITASCEDVDGAWEFLSWTLSEEAQVDVFAAAGYLSVRSDLADNEYAVEDPRIVTLNELVGEGNTPRALNYGQTFNDPNGPALTAFREALFGEDAQAALESANDAITSSLGG